MNGRKLAAFALSGVMAVGLTACGGNGEPNESPAGAFRRSARYCTQEILEGGDTFDLFARIDDDCLHAAFFNSVFTVFGTDDGCALRN